MEIGYGLNIAGFRSIPAAQLTWTSVDFGTFTDSDGTQVELNDGSVLAGRTGVGVEYGRGGGAELISEREDTAFDVGVGATYAWGQRLCALGGHLRPTRRGDCGIRRERRGQI